VVDPCLVSEYQVLNQCARVNPKFGKASGVDWSPEFVGPYESDSSRHVQWSLKPDEGLLDLQFTQSKKRGFFQITSELPQVLHGVGFSQLSFEVRILDFGAAKLEGEEAVKLSTRVQCVWPCSSHEQSFKVVGLNTWQTINIPVDTLVHHGLDLQKIDSAFQLIPDAAATQGLHLQLRNINFNSANQVVTGGIQRLDDPIGKAVPVFEEHFNQRDLSPWTWTYTATTVDTPVGELKPVNIWANDGPVVLIDWSRISGDALFSRILEKPIALKDASFTLQVAQMLEVDQLDQMVLWLRDADGKEFRSDAVSIPSKSPLPWQDVTLLNAEDAITGIDTQRITAVGLLFPRKNNGYSYFRIDSLRLGSFLSRKAEFSADDLLSPVYSDSLLKVSKQSYNYFPIRQTFTDGQGGQHIQWRDKGDWQRGQVVEVRFTEPGTQGQFELASLATNVSQNWQTNDYAFSVRVTDPGQAADPITGAVTLLYRVDCGYPCSSNVRRIVLPRVGDWYNASLPARELVKTGLDLTRVDRPLVLIPESINQAGLVIEIDNLRLEPYKWPPANRDIRWQENFNDFLPKNWTITTEGNDPVPQHRVNIGYTWACLCKPGQSWQLGTEFGQSLDLTELQFEISTQREKQPVQSAMSKVALVLTDSLGRKLTLPDFKLTGPVGEFEHTRFPLATSYPNFDLTSVTGMALRFVSQGPVGVEEVMTIDTLKFVKPNGFDY
jgi:hypothetical protein